MQLIKNATHQKLRGGFYTPELIADFILKWAFNGTHGQEVLEPSCGDGVFLERMKWNNLPYKNITAIELDKKEAEKVKKLGIKSANIINGDFYKFCNKTNKKFDIIVGNPPYIRYQYFNNEQKEEAKKIFEKINLKYSKLTNAWVSFVVGSSLLLKDGGKMGFVLPAELLQVSYAKPLRDFLAHFFHKINIISFKKLVFPDIQQEVVLLLCEKNENNKHLIEHFEVEDAKALEKIDISLLKSPKKKIDFHENKWTFYFLNQQEINLIENLKNSSKIKKINDFSNVEVGITTGANSFFTVPKLIIDKYEMNNFAKPLVGRSVQISSIIFSKDDWKKNQKKDVRANILIFPQKNKLTSSQKVLEYLKVGENNNVHKGYKCGIRDEWQIIPSIRISDALFIRRSNKHPKLINNMANAYTTDTMHRVSINKNVNKEAFVASFYNSLSFAFSEIVGRSYGGGVLELMPNEVSEILLPYKEEHSKLIKKIDEMMRDGKNINDILTYTDDVILKKGFGFSDKQIKIVNNIWKKLSNRRLNRGK